MSELMLDARNLLCPMPVIKIQNKIKTLKGGDIIHLIATDPGVEQDVPAWCRIHHHTLLSMSRVDFEIHIRIEVQNED